MKTIKQIFLAILVLFGLYFYSLPNSDHFQEAKNNKIKIDPGLTNVGFAPFTFFSPIFKCDEFLNAINREKITVLQISVLYNTFGHDYKCLDKIKKDPRLQSLQVHLINEPGHRNKRLGSYEFLHEFSSPKEYERALLRKDAKLKRKYVRYVSRLQKELADLPLSVQLLIDPGLESNISHEAFRVLAAWTRELFPRARIVFNPIKPSQNQFKDSTGDLYEQHNLIPQVRAPCIVNTDGTDINFEYVGGRKSLIAIDAEKNGSIKNFINASAPLQQYIEQYANTCEFVYIWTLEDNFNGKDLTFRDPRKRESITNGVYKHLAKEIKIAHTQGSFVPVSLEYSNEDNLSFKGCDKIEILKDTKMAGAVTDGTKSGFILKQSEFPDRGTALILKSGRKAQLFAKGKLVENYTYSGQYAHDTKRSLFRGNRKPSTFPYKTVLKVDNGKICYKIPNPRVRND